MDDTFLSLSHPSHAQCFLSFLNRQHGNIKFTMENESDGTLDFLDVRVSRLEGKFYRSVFRKNIFSVLGIRNFSSLKLKCNSIKTLVFRI